MDTSPKDSDENYDRRAKGVDETFCQSCGAIIKKEAELCPKCGVRQKIDSNGTSPEQADKPKGSMGWLIFWILVFWPVAIFYYVTRRWK